MNNNNDDQMKKIWESLSNEEKTVFATGVHFARIEKKNKIEIPDTGGKLLTATPSGRELGRWLVKSGKLDALEKLKEETGLPFYKCVEKIG